MSGRTIVAAMVGFALLAGGLLYWLNVYAYYTRLPETTVLYVTTAAGEQPLSLAAFQGIDADASPLRFRACARLADMAELAAATPADRPEPLIGPGWFDCFDAATIGEALRRGEATAYLSQHEIHLGVDRVIAVFPDGRAYAWHQLNGSLED